MLFGKEHFDYISDYYQTNIKTKPKNKYLYVARDRDDKKLYKIGVSEDPERRIKTLRTGSCRNMELLHVIYDEEIRALESYFFYVFSNYRVMGEWFRFSSYGIRKLNKTVKEELARVLKSDLTNE